MAKVERCFVVGKPQTAETPNQSDHAVVPIACLDVLWLYSEAWKPSDRNGSFMPAQPTAGRYVPASREIGANAFCSHRQCVAAAP